MALDKNRRMLVRRPIRTWDTYFVNKTLCQKRNLSNCFRKT